MVERLPYKQDVGSSSLSSPTNSIFEVRNSRFDRSSDKALKIGPRGVVVNMPACHAGDRRFKSDRGRHKYGGVSEWFMELVLKTSDSARGREFESHPLRHQLYASVAQSVEQRTENPRVGGSIPS